jgi:hypothetical protein
MPISTTRDRAASVDAEHKRRGRLGDTYQIGVKRGITFMRYLDEGYRFLFVIIGLLLAATTSPSVSVAAGNVIHRPLSDFLSTQGTYCTDDGSGGCLLFVPPDPNFLGWNTDVDKTPVLFALVDYAGLANAYQTAGQPTFAGNVTERPLPDGRAEVTVSLQTSKANIWVIELDLAGDVLAQIAGAAPTLFGHRPVDVRAGAGQALADTLLEVRFINEAPGARLPDLIQLANFPDTLPLAKLEMLHFLAHGTGPLTAAFGVSDGTPGRCTIEQTGLMSHAQPGEALGDTFPAETINLQAVGH